MLSDDICKVWQSQGAGPSPLTIEEIRAKAGEFRSLIARRNFREYLASGLMVPYFAYCAWRTPLPLMRVGNLLEVAGLAYMAYQLHRRAAAASEAPAELALNTCADFYRGQLERQRDALSGVWKWYLGPLVPGLATILAASCIAAFHRSVLAAMLALAVGGVVALALWGLGRVNQKAAAGIQRQIDGLG